MSIPHHTSPGSELGLSHRSQTPMCFSLWLALLLQLSCEWSLSRPVITGVHSCTHVRFAFYALVFSLLLFYFKGTSVASILYNFILCVKSLWTSRLAWSMLSLDLHVCIYVFVLVRITTCIKVWSKNYRKKQIESECYVWLCVRCSVYAD